MNVPDIHYRFPSHGGCSIGKISQITDETTPEPYEQMIQQVTEGFGQQKWGLIINHLNGQLTLW